MNGWNNTSYVISVESVTVLEKIVIIQEISAYYAIVLKHNVICRIETIIYEFYKSLLFSHLIYNQLHFNFEVSFHLKRLN